MVSSLCFHVQLALLQRGAAGVDRLQMPGVRDPGGAPVQVESSRPVALEIARFQPLRLCRDLSVSKFVLQIQRKRPVSTLACAYAVISRCQSLRFKWVNLCRYTPCSLDRKEKLITMAGGIRAA